jgi:hypothetical protein
MVWSVKRPKVGVYGNKTRSLQSRLAYEKVSLTWKTAFVWLYLGSRENATPTTSDVQVTAFMEVPDRAYASTPVEINIWNEENPEQSVDLSQFGIMNPIGDEKLFRVHVNSYDQLGRVIRTGDVIEMPFFSLGGKRAFWEIIDVDREQEYEKYYSILKAIPLDNKREANEIPINRDNGGILGAYTDQVDTEGDDAVPYNGVDTDDVTVDDPNTDMTDEFDPRDEDTKKSFLDDPTKTF